ncbi:helix-turn-helix transcriptional regulator [Jeotgalibaca caeni]|uniref:helix-turn-helix transcriptional regulator n=1 Tax=Jeotgalibaca caeni TaxID=3028623 RepID=UPI00237DCBEA|nr:AraC family transcriptional regulator [Jeotgalibaca caeni]MDE1549076.1 AraC family transcriptional regulator [Jeotgalibaca caeni]
MFFFEHHGLGEQESFSHTLLVNQSFPIHFHRAAELIWVEEGEIIVSIENNEFSLREGDSAFVFPHQLHGIQSLETSRLQILIFSPEWIGHFFTEYKGQVPKRPIFSLPSFLPLDKLNSVYAKKSFLYGICDELIRNTEFVRSEFQPKTKMIQKLIAYVDQHYTENLTLKEAAVALQYDYVYLSKLFKQVTQYSFTEYLNQYRISQVCYQLRGTQKTVSEIALDCGYQNMRTFHRNFKQMVGCTPSDYRSR